MKMEEGIECHAAKTSGKYKHGKTEDYSLI